jgi:predicted dehydrogenase
MHSNSVTRRDFLGTAGAAAALTLIPRHVLRGQGRPAPSDTVNIAVVGGGGRGAVVATELLSGAQNLVALADVDLPGVDARVARSIRSANGQPNEPRLRLQAAYGKAKRYTDFRRMFEQQRDIDAVLIATPDHTHAVIAKAAMELGKHVYVEKPMTWSVHEARVMRETARRTNVVTQMGNQGQSTDGARLINEWIQAGLIGPVREVHLSTDRPIWPQGIPRPARSAAAMDSAAYTSPLPPPRGSEGAGNDWTPPRKLSQELGRTLSGEHTPSPDLDWDLFLGPAPKVPYHPLYHPFNWRGWIDWGTGAVGDIAAHTLNHAYWALGLTYPTTVEATSTAFGLNEDGTPASYPAAMEVVFRYAAEGSRPAVTVFWRDGSLWAPRPAVLREGVSHRRAAIIIGDRGVLMHDSYGNNPRLYPESLMEAASKVPQTYARVPGELHAMNWVDAIRNHTKATADFEYTSRLTENMLLGIVAVRTGQGVQIRYDGHSGTVLNNAGANQLLSREYRHGWSL